MSADGTQDLGAPESTASVEATSKSANPIGRAIDGVEWIADTIAMTALVALMLVTVINAVLRYLIDAPIPGSLSISLLYLMPAIIFLALPRVQADGAHISATLVVDLLGPTGKQICRLIVLVVVTVILTLLLVASLEEVGHSWNAILPGFPPLPLGPSWVLLPIGVGGAIFRGCWQIVTRHYTQEQDQVIEGVVVVETDPTERLASTVRGGGADD